MSAAIERVQPAGAITTDALTIEDLVCQVRLVQDAMRAVMKRGEHYGIIPGTSTKPTLLKPGAEKLCLLFRLGPTYSVTEQRDGEHLTVLSTCTMHHIPTGNVVAFGMGSCSTRESKYAYRTAQRSCPKCGKATIFKSRKDGEGWYCWRKKDGCGETFAASDTTITGQQTGRVPNPDVADTWNTVLKMANKRSLVAAVLNATAASDIFTQDVEDLPEFQRTTAEPAATAGAPAETDADVVSDWCRRMVDCETDADLLALGQQLRAATMAEADREALREAFVARRADLRAQERERREQAAHSYDPDTAGREPGEEG